MPLTTLACSTIQILEIILEIRLFSFLLFLLVIFMLMLSYFKSITALLLYSFAILTLVMLSRNISLKYIFVQIYSDSNVHSKTILQSLE